MPHAHNARVQPALAVLVDGTSGRPPPSSPDLQSSFHRELPLCGFTRDGNPSISNNRSPEPRIVAPSTT
jgi:hypothetical protein